MPYHVIAQFTMTVEDQEELADMLVLLDRTRAYLANGAAPTLCVEASEYTPSNDEETRDP